ncbi:MAG: methyltransferase [Pseudomonadota bacterium]
MTITHSASTLVLGLLLCSVLHAQQSTTDNAALLQAVDARSAESKARDAARNPYQTLEFFQVEPGMTVAEASPGGGWYTEILANYLGPDGTLYGVNNPDQMWALYPNSTEEWRAERIAGTAQFPKLVADVTDNGIKAEGFTFNTVPPNVVGTVDRVLFMRALHGLNRFEDQIGSRTQALAATRSMLKDDGMVGVVQHRAVPTDSESGTDGSRGYLEEADVIEFFEDAGFELVDTAEINANPNDVPGPEDIVWRLPPSLATSRDNPELRVQMQAIGESDRMTLLFKKASS